MARGLSAFTMTSGLGWVDRRRIRHRLIVDRGRVLGRVSVAGILTFARNAVHRNHRGSCAIVLRIVGGFGSYITRWSCGGEERGSLCDATTSGATGHGKGIDDVRNSTLRLAFRV